MTNWGFARIRPDELYVMDGRYILLFIIALKATFNADSVIGS